MLTVSLGLITAALQQPAVLTLEEALAMADRNAFSIRIAQLNRDKAKSKISESKGAQGFRLGATTTYNRFDRELTANLGSSTITTRAIDSLQSQLALSLPIDLSGTLSAIVAASAAFYEASALDLDATRNSVRFDTRQGYFQILQAQRALAIYQDALKLAQERERVVAVQLQEGAVAKVDLLRAQTQTSQTKTDLLIAENNLQLAKAALNQLLARPANTAFEIQEPSEPTTIESSEDEILQAALNSRPEIRALDQRGKGLSKITKSQRGGLAPSLNFSLQYTHDWKAEGFSASANTTVGVLSLAVPILDSGITKSRVDQAKKDEQILQVQRAQAVNGISLEVNQALTNFKNAKSRVEVGAQQVATAEENYRLAKLKTEEGEGINLEVIDAQNALTAARVGLANAQYELQVAVAAIRRAIGSDQVQK